MSIYTGFDQLHIDGAWVTERPSKDELRAMIMSRVERDVTPEEAVARIREVRYGPDEADD